MARFKVKIFVDGKRANSFKASSIEEVQLAIPEIVRKNTRGGLGSLEKNGIKIQGQMVREVRLSNKRWSEEQVGRALVRMDPTPGSRGTGTRHSGSKSTPAPVKRARCPIARSNAR